MENGFVLGLDIGGTNIRMGLKRNLGISKIIILRIIERIRFYGERNIIILDNKVIPFSSKCNGRVH